MEHPENVDLAILNTSEAWIVDPEKFLSKARNTPLRRMACHRASAGDHHRLHAGIQPHSLTADSNRRKPAVSGGQTHERKYHAWIV